MWAGHSAKQKGHTRGWQEKTRRRLGELVSHTKVACWGELVSHTKVACWGELVSHTKVACWGELVSHTKVACWGELVSHTKVACDTGPNSFFLFLSEAFFWEEGLRSCQAVWFHHGCGCTMMKDKMLCFAMCA